MEETRVDSSYQFCICPSFCSLSFLPHFIAVKRKLFWEKKKRDQSIEISHQTLRFNRMRRTPFERLGRRRRTANLLWRIHKTHFDDHPIYYRRESKRASLRIAFWKWNLQISERLSIWSSQLWCLQYIFRSKFLSGFLLKTFGWVKTFLVWEEK